MYPKKNIVRRGRDDLTLFRTIYATNRIYKASRFSELLIQHPSQSCYASPYFYPKKKTGLHSLTPFSIPLLYICVCLLHIVLYYGLGGSFFWPKIGEHEEPLQISTNKFLIMHTETLVSWVGKPKSSIFLLIAR